MADGHAAVRTRVNRQGPREHEIWDLDAHKAYVVAMPGFDYVPELTPRGLGGQYVGMIWTDAIAERPAVKRGRMVNRTWGEPSSQLHERHDAGDFETSTQDKVAVSETAAGA